MHPDPTRPYTRAERRGSWGMARVGQKLAPRPHAKSSKRQPRRERSDSRRRLEAASAICACGRAKTTENARVVDSDAAKHGDSVHWGVW